MNSVFSPSEEALLIVGMMLVTYLARYPLMALSGKVSLPEPVERALAYVPVAVLTAISVPMVLKPGGDWLLEVTNPYLWASLVAIVIARLTSHLLLTIVVGMLCFFVLKLVFT